MSGWRILQRIGRIGGRWHGARGLAGVEGLNERAQPLRLGDRAPVAALGRLADAVEAALGLIEVGEDELGLDRLDVAQRVDAPLGVHDVGILVDAHDVDDRVGLADVGQELVAQPLAAVRARDQAGDVVEGDRVGHDLGRLDRGGDLVEAFVDDRDDGDVGLDRRERVVGRLRGHAGQRAEQRGFARVGHADDPDLHARVSAPDRGHALATAVPSSAPASTSLG